MPCNGSFVTLAAGDRAVAGALCLKRQMRLVNSSCPLRIVIEDQASLKMSPSSVERIARAYGAESVVLMSTLIARVRTRGHGRRLILDALGAEASTSKYWLWAWPTQEKLAFLDTDILILRNVDDLLDVQLSSRSSLAAIPSCSSANIQWFNGGVLVFIPSLNLLQKLQTLDRWTHYPWRGFIGKGRWADICAPFDGCKEYDCLAARRVLNGLFRNGSYLSNSERQKRSSEQTNDPFKACRWYFNGSFHPSGRIPLACEPRYTDQSILNRAFPHYMQLPNYYNVVRQPRVDLPCEWPMNTSERVAVCRYGFQTTGDVAIIHAVGEPKPWAVKLPRERLKQLRTMDGKFQTVSHSRAKPKKREKITALFHEKLTRNVQICSDEPRIKNNCYQNNLPPFNFSDQLESTHVHFYYIRRLSIT